MRAECIDCHNTHPDSPKTDWKIGDVRGVLEISLPLDGITGQTIADLRKTATVYSVAGFGLAFIIGFVVITLLQRSRDLKRRVERRTAELRSEIAQRHEAMEVLADTRERDRLLLNSAGEGIYGLDLQGRASFVNPAVCRMLGYEESELLGRPMHALVHHSYVDGLEYPREKCPIYAAFTDGRQHRATNEVLWRKDGSSIPVEYTSTPIRKEGRLVGAVVVVTDLSEQKKMEERFRLGIDASPAAMIMVDEHGVILHVNNQAERMFGYSRGQLVGELVEVLLPDGLRSAHLSHRKEYVSNPTSRRLAGRDLLAQKKNKQIFPVEVSLNPIDTTGGVVVLCSIIDLTERKKFEAMILSQAAELEEANKLLSAQAVTDSLTGIGNRRSWSYQLATMLLLAGRNGLPVSVLMTDIDGFKTYNDEFGHPSGDAVLKTVARTLVDETRDSDFVARYGGEEFAVLLPETGPEDALMVAEKIRHKVEYISGFKRNVTISIGAATLRFERHAPFDVTKIGEKLVDEADRALYYSKGTGRNRVTHIDSVG
jgi:diguanylate cyclase (GGDEF)-like protein/PAS domain S-box-containing protein